MSRDDVQRWKDKYLENIEQQERLQRRWDARIDLLRRGLVRSSLAAEGSDKAVDQCMKELREILRRDDMDAALSVQGDDRYLCYNTRYLGLYASRLLFFHRLPSRAF